MNIPALWPLAQQTAGAVIAWVIAVLLTGQPDPFFAPIAAVIGLNAAIGRRGSNAVRLVIGVVVGVVVAEVAVWLIGGGVLTLAVTTFAAMVIAQRIDSARIVQAQAAVSAILVTTLGTFDQGWYRLLEALFGVGVALVFTQLLLVPEPLRLLRRAESEVLVRLAEGLRLIAAAVKHRDPAQPERATDHLRDLRDQLADLATMRKASDRIVRHSLTWRSRAAPLVVERERADQLDLLAGSTLMLARTVMAAVDRGRRALVPAVQSLAVAIEQIAADPSRRDVRQDATQRAMDLARWVVEHGRRIPGQSPASGAGAALRMVAVDVMIFAGADPDQAFASIHPSGAERLDAVPPDLSAEADTDCGHPG